MSAAAVETVVREGLLSLDPPALLAGRCGDCGARHFPARSLCPECQGTTIALAALSGQGTLYTFTIVRATPPGYIGTAPYALGIVELPEGLRVTATITADDLDALAIDDPVTFELIALGTPDVPVLSFAYRHGGSA